MRTHHPRGVVVAVRVCGVEQRDACVDRGGDELDRTVVVALGQRRETHAAECDVTHQ
jgi:hypothetical protein